MLKNKKKSKRKEEQKYNVGDTVFLLAYPTSNFRLKSKELNIFKMKITEILTDENGTTYRTNRQTGLEYKNGGYSSFNNLETIKKAINEFCEEEFMDWLEQEKVEDK